MIAALFGGRVAEELIFGDDAVTTGASNDIERATDLARNMVTKWGLSDKMGPLAYAEEQQEVFQASQPHNRIKICQMRQQVQSILRSEKLSIHSTRERPNSSKTILIRCILWLTHL